MRITFGINYKNISYLPTRDFQTENTHTNHTPTTGQTKHPIAHNLRDHENSHQLPAQSLILNLMVLLIAKNIMFFDSMANNAFFFVGISGFVLVAVFLHCLRILLSTRF